MKDVLLIQADARRLPLPDGSVHCCVTSPPYWGLRDYGHEGQIGLEPTPGEYVATMVDVFREVRRVLRADGTLWLNIGDCFVGGNNTNNGGNANFGTQPGRDGMGDTAKSQWRGLPQKNLVGIPWRLAFALQTDGWYLRSDIIWAKPNPMPESVTDRPTKAHEYLFLFSKRPTYFYDADAIREPITSTGGASFGKQDFAADGTGAQSRRLDDPAERNHPLGRNKRSVWNIATQSCPEAHFATFPVALPRLCIQAGTSDKGCCPACGAPWGRVTEGGELVTSGPNALAIKPRSRHRRPGETPLESRPVDGYGDLPRRERIFLGWQSSCPCDAGLPVPCTVLDNFSGSATTGVAAKQLGRRYVGIERKADYIGIARRRLAKWQENGRSKAAEPDAPGQIYLFAEAM